MSTSDLWPIATDRRRKTVNVDCFRQPLGAVQIYPYILTLDSNHTWLVRFPDIPEAVTVGEDVREAAINAQEALEAALEIYVDGGRPIPAPFSTTMVLASATLSPLAISHDSKPRYLGWAVADLPTFK